VSDSSGALGPSDLGSIDALKRIKAAETEWDERIASARQETEAALRRLAEESDATVKAAHAEADGARSASVQRARANADREAETIVAEGAKAAEAAARGTGKRPADHSAEVLAAVLGSFGED
jgi:vacuolar-type H+-ATPase subunit H